MSATTIHEPAPRNLSRRWWLARSVLLTAALAGFALVVHGAAAPEGIALRPPPAQPSAPTDVDSPMHGIVRTRHHVVLVVDDPELAQALQRRISAEALTHAEYGADSPPATFEVIRVAPGQDLQTLDTGLTEYHARCVSSACPALRVLDLRARRSER